MEIATAILVAVSVVACAIILESARRRSEHEEQVSRLLSRLARYAEQRGGQTGQNVVDNFRIRG